MDFPFATCDGKSIYEFLIGQKGNNGGGPISVGSNNGINIDVVDGLDRLDYFVVIAGCIVVAVVGIIKEKKLLGEEGIQKLWLPVRWTLYYALIFAVLILGAYGMGLSLFLCDFVYIFYLF